MIDVALTLEEVRGIAARRRDRGRHRRGARLHDDRGRPRRRRAGGDPGRPPPTRRGRSGPRVAGGPVLVGGERGGAPAAGLRSRQLPGRVHRRIACRGRTVVFTTTNGTRALLALAGAQPGRRRRLRQRRRRRPLGGRPSRATPSWSARASAGASAWRTRSAPGSWSRASRPPTARSPTPRGRPRALWDRYAGDLGAMLADATWAQALVGPGAGRRPARSASPSTSTTWSRSLRDGALVAATELDPPRGASP